MQYLVLVWYFEYCIRKIVLPLVNPLIVYFGITLLKLVFELKMKHLPRR